MKEKKKKHQTVYLPVIQFIKEINSLPFSYFAPGKHKL